MTISESLALAAVLAGAAAWAQGAPSTNAAAQREQERIRVESGLVIAVDAASGKMTLRNDAGREKRYSAEEAKVIAAEGKTISLADLVIGDRVSLSRRGKSVLEIVRLHKAPKR